MRNDELMETISQNLTAVFAAHQVWFSAPVFGNLHFLLDKLLSQFRLTNE